jgi:hypothetical protein
MSLLLSLLSSPPSPTTQVHTYLPEALPKSRISVPDTPATTDEMARLTGGTEYVKLETLKASGERSCSSLQSP